MCPAPERVSTRGSSSFNPNDIHKPLTPATPAVVAPAAPVPAPAAPAAVVTPPAEPAAAPAEEQPADTREPHADQQEYVARRRKVRNIAVIIAVVVAFIWLAKPWELLSSSNPQAASTTGATASTGAGQAATDQVGADLTFAEAYLATNGTLDGLAIDGAQVAVSGTTLYAVRTIDGICTVYGLLNGQRLTPTADTTGGACAGQIVTVQAQLDASAQQAASTSTYAAEDTLKTAAGAAVAFASRNYVNGVPSMTGLPGSLAGALTLDNTGEYVTIRVSYPGACVETFVTAAGEIGETNTCS